MIKKARFFTLCIGLLSTLSSGGEICSGQELVSRKRLDLEVDVSRFMTNSGVTRLEIYQSIGRRALSYEKGSVYSVAQFSIQTAIIKNDSTIFSTTTTGSDSVKDLTEIKSGQQFVYTVPLLLEPGEYQVVSTLRDSVANRSRKDRLTIAIASFSPDSLTFSDIQFATDIEKVKPNDNRYQKNKLHVTPNPKAQFGDSNNALTFYSELYNLPDKSGGPGTYRVDYIIENEDGELLHHIKGKKRKKTGKHAAIFTSFDISALATGIYGLRLVAHDDETGLEATTWKRFFVIWDEDILAKSAEPEPGGNPYLSLDDEALDNYFTKIHYIATSEEQELFKSLDQSGKQSFLVEFWERRDPSPGTPTNEFKEDYIQRLIEVMNAQFGAGFVEGWRTDRGRVLLTYGNPDFMDRESETSDRRSTEIWHYNSLEGGVIFVFVDMRANGLYELVHSTYTGEVSFPNWESYVNK